MLPLLLLLACSAPLLDDSDRAPEASTPRDAPDLDPPAAKEGPEPEKQQEAAEVDFCSMPASPAFELALTCGTVFVGDSNLDGDLPELPASRCDYPAGPWSTLYLDEAGPLIVTVELCSPGGEVVVFDESPVCYGAANSGDEWQVYPLPDHTIGVRGGRYVVEVEPCR